MNYYSRFKYQQAVPKLIRSVHFFFGDKNRDTIGLPEIDFEFFTIGSGRNGSTLLGALLNRHPDIYLSPEQYVLPYTIFRWHLLRHQDWLKVCEGAMHDFVQHTNWVWNDQDREYLMDHIKSLPIKYRNIANIYRSMCLHFARRLNKTATIIGDHSPKMTYFTKTLLNEFPNSKFLFLVRDPRDVILSYSKLAQLKYKMPEGVVRKWIQSVETFHRIRSIEGNRIEVVKYEDLVLKTEITMRNISKFLDIPFTKKMTQQDLDLAPCQMNVRDEERHQNLSKPISGDSVNRWERELSPEIVDNLSPKLRFWAREFGYQI